MDVQNRKTCISVNCPGGNEAFTDNKCSSCNNKSWGRESERCWLHKNSLAEVLLKFQVREDHQNQNPMWKRGISSTTFHPSFENRIGSCQEGCVIRTLHENSRSSQVNGLASREFQSPNVYRNGLSLKWCTLVCKQQVKDKRHKFQSFCLTGGRWALYQRARIVFRSPQMTTVVVIFVRENCVMQADWVSIMETRAC